MKRRLIREKHYYTMHCVHYHVLLRVTDLLLENGTIIIANEGKFNAKEIIIVIIYRNQSLLRSTNKYICDFGTTKKETVVIK